VLQFPGARNQCLTWQLSLPSIPVSNTNAKNFIVISVGVIHVFLSEYYLKETLAISLRTLLTFCLETLMEILKKIHSSSQQSIIDFCYKLICYIGIVQIKIIKLYHIGIIGWIYRYCALYLQGQYQKTMLLPCWAKSFHETICHLSTII